MEHTRKCPICGNRHHKLLFKIKLANFDQYSCFNNFRIAYCTKCGFLLNDIYYTPEEINKFYVEESPYSTASSYGAGGNSNADVERYEKYLSIIKPYINKKSRICDVGCAKGGLLEFLVANGYKNVYGVEMSPKLVEISKAAGLNIQLGNAAHIPLPIDRKKYDCLFFTNVFEHLFDLSEVLLSINNSLTENGHIFIEVPDYENYSNIDFYPYYHLLNPREHINHFSAYHLSLIMKQFGFDCVYTGHDILKLNNSRYGCNPSLIMVFTPPPHLTALTIRQNLHDNPPIESYALRMKDYIIQSKIKMEKISEIIMQYKQNQKPIYIWGISSDFFIAASFTDLFKCNIIGLIDRNTDKQQLSWKNMKIFSHNILKNLDKNDTVFIFSVYNSNVMRQYLYNLHIDCDIIDIVDILN